MASRYRVVYVTFGQDPAGDGLLHSQAIEPLLTEMRSRDETSGSLVLLTFIPLHRYILGWPTLRGYVRGLRAQGVRVVSLPVPSRNIFVSPAGERILRSVGWVLGFGLRKSSVPTLYVARSYPAGVIASGAANTHGCPWVLDGRGVFVEEGVTSGRWAVGDSKYRRWRDIEYRLLRDANRVIAVTREHAGLLLQRGADPARTVVAPCRGPSPCNSPADYSATLEDVARFTRACRAQGGHVYVYSGSLGLWTDLETIESLLADLGANTARDTLVLLLPSDSMARRVTRLVSERRRFPRCLVLSLPVHEVAAALQLCDLALLPRPNDLVNQVSSPVKLAEYLLAGLPVAARPNDGFIGRMLRRQRLGCIVPAGDTGSSVPVASPDSSDDRTFRSAYADRLFGPTVAGHRYAAAVLESLGKRPSHRRPDGSDILTVAALTTGPRLDPCTRQRVLQYAPSLREKGIRVRLLPFMSGWLHSVKNRRGLQWVLVKALLMGYCVSRRPIHIARARFSDIVLVQKEAFPFGPPTSERWLARHRPMVLDIDDAHHLPPAGRWDWRGLWRDPHRLQKTMSYADCVIAGNSWLGDLATTSGAQRVDILPTGVPAYNGRAAIVARTAHQTSVKVGWIGTFGTLKYMDLIASALVEVATIADVSVVLIGAANVHEWRPPGLRVTSFDWREEDEAEMLQGLDIGVMPLGDGPLELGKCAYKILQYMSAGLPVVASAVGENRNVLLHGVTGYLAENSEEWTKYLTNLAFDARLRHTLGMAGEARVRGLYAAQVVGPDFAEIIGSVWQEHHLRNRAGRSRTQW